MLFNGNNQELISESTTGSIDKNSRPNTFSTSKDIRNVSRISVDSVSGQIWAYRTTTGDTSQNYLNLSSSWYQSYLGALTVDQRQELTSITNNNATLCRKRWAYS